MSLAQVANGKVSRTAIHLIELGKSKPSFETLQLIASRTGKPISYFVASTESMPRGPQLSDIQAAFARGELPRVLDLGTAILQGDVDRPTEASIRCLLGRAQLRMGDGQEALAHSERAMELFNAMDDVWKSVECLDQIACAYFLLDDPRSRPLAEEALRRCRDLEPVPSELESRILGNVAIMHVHARHWQQAIHFYEECLKVGEQVRDLRHRALTYDGLSLAYERMGRLREATSYAHKAIALHSMESDVAAIAQAENNLGDILMRMGQLDDAERHVRASLKLCDDHGLESAARSYSLLTLGEIYVKRERPEASEILNEAIRVSELQAQRVPVACAHQLLGRQAAGDGDKESAIQEFEIALGLLDQLKMPERLRDCLLEYAAYLESVGESASHVWKRAALVGAELARPFRPFGTYLTESEASAG
jgi:tetratricopeptide (TPR) repeat protein